MQVSKRRIWGWMFFDWAQQPYATLGLTFIFSPYFAAVAADWFVGQGLERQAANAEAQSLWSSAQTVSGLFIAFTAPIFGAMADSSGRKVPWIAAFCLIGVVCAWATWGLTPDGAFLIGALVLFWIGYTAAECAFNLNNALLPSLGGPREVGRISGSSTAFGYWGGVLGLAVMLTLLAETEAGTTLIGLEPAFGLDPDTREGTRAVGPVIAIWFAVFLVPYFLWVRDPAPVPGAKVRLGATFRELGRTLRGLTKRPSLASFLAGSMLYRDALTAVYSFGGIYATLVLGWETVQVGVFGIVAAIAAAIIAWIGGLADGRHGPKPVILLSVWVLIAVGCIIVGMSRESFFGIPLAEGSRLPDIVFYLCGAAIGGAGGTLFASSRSMMTRHCDLDRPAEAFGLFALSGKATAFLAPLLITIFTQATGSVQAGFVPVILLFLGGLFLLRWTDKDGDRAEWSVSSPASPSR
ncbi:MFS transporter [Histidinibacterium lentulum]|uniref:MFS transporter n=1 Tax=Histidinibacterium lentulum TaxID=2480588 RepID=A0A3N2R168_9RHOB|nr:MFS transporter [Histidinibacterium lentulum]ROU01229.1 MFS transporter [Histidinibacterium lentulum]